MRVSATVTIPSDSGRALFHRVGGQLRVNTVDD